MDLGAAAEEIAGVYLAILLFATLVAHLLAVVLCTIPWFASWRPAR